MPNSNVWRLIAGHPEGQYGDADGVGTAARFNAPMSCICDTTGRYLYVADTGNLKVKRVDLADGTTTTIIDYSDYAYPIALSGNNQMMTTKKWQRADDRFAVWLQTSIDVNATALIDVYDGAAHHTTNSSGGPGIGYPSPYPNYTGGYVQPTGKFSGLGIDWDNYIADYSGPSSQSCDPPNKLCGPYHLMHPLSPWTGSQMLPPPSTFFASGHSIVIHQEASITSLCNRDWWYECRSPDENCATWTHSERLEANIPSSNTFDAPLYETTAPNGHPRVILGKLTNDGKVVEYRFNSNSTLPTAVFYYGGRINATTQNSPVRGLAWSNMLGTWVGVTKLSEYKAQVFNQSGQVNGTGANQVVALDQEWYVGTVGWK